MTLITPHLVASQRDQLRALNNEHRETMEALNHAQASIVQTQKLNEINYHRKRKQILSDGHGQEDA